MSEESTYQGFDGTTMLLRIWKPEGEPRAIVLGIHGLGSHSGLLDFMAEQFTSRGFTFYAPDMRGFGTYPGRKGHVESYDEYIDDMESLVAYLKLMHHDNKLFLFGHSLGGLHIVRYIAHHPGEADGIMIPCPAVSEKLKMSGAIRAIAKFLSKLNAKIYFSNGLDYDLVSRNPEVVKRNREDPLRFDKATPRYGIEGFKASEEGFNLASKITVPVLVQQSGDDMIVDPERNKEFYDNIASKDKTWKLYPGLYHEPFQEEGSDEVLADLFDWLDERMLA
ncbi:MAG: alpha/beta hydrolase [Candidatus Thorarchaeota archaeon]|jgi:alpha-beta hydrolase superfamily lysophospholipase